MGNLNKITHFEPKYKEQPPSISYKSPFLVKDKSSVQILLCLTKSVKLVQRQQSMSINPAHARAIRLRQQAERMIWYIEIRVNENCYIHHVTHRCHTKDSQNRDNNIRGSSYE